MLYMMLVFQNEASAKLATQAERDEAERVFEEFHAKMRARGRMQAAVRLRHTDTATMVRVRGGKLLTTDGPYAETKEQLGGLADVLADYMPYHAARADLLRRVGEVEEACQAYVRAIEYADNIVERSCFERQRNVLQKETGSLNRLNQADLGRV